MTEIYRGEGKACHGRDKVIGLMTESTCDVCEQEATVLWFDHSDDEYGQIANGRRDISAKMIRDLKRHPFWAARFTRKADQ